MMTATPETAGPSRKRGGNLFGALLDFVWPPKCLICDRVGSTLCEECIAEWPRAGHPMCAVCGDEIGPDGCLGCSWGIGPLTASGYAVKYTETVRKVVHALKYDGRTDLAAPMALEMAYVIRTRPAFQEFDAFVPVALHPKRFNERGYNQADLLANAIAEETGYKVLRALQRTRYTRPQVGLGRKERAENVRGAFTASDACRGLRVVLIDDVCTTWATGRDAARALIAVGAASVSFLTFSRDLPVWSEA